MERTPGGSARSHPLAWKLELELGHGRHKSYPPEETWTVRGIRVPSADGVTEIHATTNFLGVDFELVAMRRGASVPEPVRPHVHEGAQLELQHSGINPHDEVKIVGIKDDRERELKAPHWAGGATYRNWGVEVTDDVKTLDVTFTFVRVRKVEFVVEPEWIEGRAKKQRQE